jgi:hypothetical protein
MNSFATRAVAQTAGLLIPVTLRFISAGTIHFWQGWPFWLSFLASSTAIGVYLMKHDPALLERRMRVGPQAESRPSQRIIIEIILVVFIALAIVPGLDHGLLGRRYARGHSFGRSAIGFAVTRRRREGDELSLLSSQRFVGQFPYTTARTRSRLGRALSIVVIGARVPAMNKASSIVEISPRGPAR